MSAKIYRLKVNRVPLTNDIVYKTPNFPPFNELHLKLLENKIKLKNNASIPIFVRPEPSKERESFSKKGSNKEVENDEFTIDDLECAYNNSDVESQEKVFSDNDTTVKEETKESQSKKNGEYQPEYFEKQNENIETAEEKEKKDRADMLFNFMVLRKKYPNVEIPEFTEHTDLDLMNRVYSQTIRKLSLDSSVETYKGFLQAGFVMMEWTATNLLGIDISGFAANQLNSMNKYEHLLIELGEKNKFTIFGNLPVEVRLLGLCFINAAVFYFTKKIFSGGSGNEGGFNLFSMFGGGNKGTGGEKKRRGNMKGPSVSAADVEKMTKQKDPEDEEDDEHEKDD